MRDKSALADLEMARIATQQHGVVSSRQLMEAGLTRHGITRRVQSGRLHRVHQGVYAVGHVAISHERVWMAAVIAYSNDRQDRVDDTILGHWGVALSHRSAAALWQLLPPTDGSVDVSVPVRGGRKKRRGIRAHRSQTLLSASVTSRHGIPVTTPARTIADLRRVVAKKGRDGAITSKDLRRAIRQAELLGLPTGAEAITERSRSDLELAFLRLCRRYGLPEPEVNVWIESVEVDFLWRQARLVVETDGYRYHRGRIAFETDRDRDLRLRMRDYDVIRLSEQQVDEEPERVAEVLRTALL